MHGKSPGGWQRPPVPTLEVLIHVPRSSSKKDEKKPRENSMKPTVTHAGKLIPAWYLTTKGYFLKSHFNII